jgi:hypothetical protein
VNAGSGPLSAGRHDDNTLMCDGLPIADYVTHIRRELDAVGERIKSESVTIGGVAFESYDDTLKCFTTHCDKDDWKYVMYMPALYSLVKTDGKNLKALLEEQSHSSKAGYASSKQARLYLSFQCKIPEVFGPGKETEMNHPLGDVSTYSKWSPTGNEQVFHPSVEDEIRRVKASTTTKMSVQLRSRPEAHRLFLLMLTYLVNHMFKFHQMSDGQLLC